MMISSRQMKAARALLGWKQADLAEKAGLHINAVNRIEQEIVAPRAETLARIQTVLEMNGVKFRGLRGVELRDEQFEILRLEGADSLTRLTNDILHTVASPKDEVLNFLTDEHLFDQMAAQDAKRYAAHRKKTGFKERYITLETHASFRRGSGEAYRGLPSRAMGPVAYVVYGTRVAFIHWKKKETLIVSTPSLAETFRAQFDYLWEQAKPFGPPGGGRKR